jgi:hypothetical protein
MMYFYTVSYLICVYYASCGTAEELVLHPNHGITFWNVGLLANDIIICHQTFVLYIPKVVIPITRSAMLEFSPKKNDVSEFDRITQPLVSDYSK